jgi:hypothetical protein
LATVTKKKAEHPQRPSHNGVERCFEGGKGGGHGSGSKARKEEDTALWQETGVSALKLSTTPLHSELLFKLATPPAKKPRKAETKRFAITSENHGGSKS